MLVHGETVGALRRDVACRILDQFERPGVAREPAGAPWCLDHGEPRRTARQRGDLRGTAYPKRAGMVAQQRRPAIRGQP